MILQPETVEMIEAAREEFPEEEFRQVRTR